MKPSLYLLLLSPCVLTARPAGASALLKPSSGVSVALSPKTFALDARLRGAFAQTTITTVYANPNPSRIEADFLYSAPKNSVVTGFAYWYRGEKVVARIVEKGRAAKIYQYITSRMRDPALIEMIGPNRFRARIFPIEAQQDLKIEVQLVQKLDATPAGPRWSWPLREETSQNPLAQLSLHVHSDAPFTSNLGAARDGHLEFERQNFQAQDDARVTLDQPAAPLHASLIGARDGGRDGFFALSLSSSTPVAFPRVAFSGVQTYDVLVPTRRRLDAHTPFVVVGRYRGHGEGFVSFNGRRVRLSFPDARQERNIAELLWASARMEALSNSQRNRALVSALSLRFEMPSKWTSWLAIPEEERQRFKRQMWASDRGEAARAYAQAVSRGDRPTMRAQKAIFDDLTKKLEKDGPNYASNEELQPLQAYLNDELRRLQSAQLEGKLDPTISKTQRAQWAIWTKNLERAGASRGGDGVEMPIYLLEDELRIASRLYVQEVEAGRANGAQAKRLQARLAQLAQTKVARNYGWNSQMFMSEQAQMRANALAMEVAAQRSSDHPDRARETQAMARLTRLQKFGGIDAQSQVQSALNGLWNTRVQVVAQGWSNEIRAGRLNSAQAAKLRAQLKAIQARTGMDNQYPLAQVARALRESLASEIAQRRENGTAATQLRAQLAALKREFPRGADEPYGWFNSSSYGYGAQSEQFAWEGRAHEAAYRLLDAQAKGASNQAQIEALQADLSHSAKMGGKDENAVLSVEKTRLAQGLPLVTANDYRLRPGDPLIAVSAPALCQSVLAIMPDGSLLPLRWNELARRWEARFDVPAFAPEGDYTVRILVVAPDGTRRQLAMRFAVDLRSPEGSGAIRRGAGVWHLSLQTDDLTDRVSAFTPWNTRVELKRGENNLFAAAAPLPANAAEQSGATRFVLTDKAHNRTEIVVDSR